MPTAQFDDSSFFGWRLPPSTFSTYASLSACCENDMQTRTLAHSHTHTLTHSHTHMCSRRQRIKCVLAFVPHLCFCFSFPRTLTHTQSRVVRVCVCAFNFGHICCWRERERERKRLAGDRKRSN